jgi:hypothetical protein
MQTCLSISIGEILHWDIQMLEVSWEDPSDTESDDGHSSPGPYEPWVSDDTGKSKSDSGRDGLIEESE